MKASAPGLIVLIFLMSFGSPDLYPEGARTVVSFTKEADGALCQMADGTKLKLQVCAENIIRVVHTSEAAVPSPQGLIVGRPAFTPPASWDAADDGTSILVTTPQITAAVSKSTGLISFANSSGTAVCSETARSLAATEKGGVAGFSGTLAFDSPADEGVYGLGNLSMAEPAWSGDPGYWAAVPPDNSGVLNIREFTVDMHQSNWYDVLPFFMTTRGYGVLMNFACHATKTPPLTFTADYLLNNSWDYFFIYGPQFDTVISGYRYVTGPAPMLSKWAYGFWQCKNRYVSAADLITAISEYRTRGIPLDCIVQDWQWWTGGQEGWGSFTWNPDYPDPAGMLTTMHDNNCHFSISIWPAFYPGTPHYEEMAPHLLTAIDCNDFPGEFLNMFDTVGLEKFWNLMNTSCFSIGVDSWWMDATEPECPLLTGVATNMGMIDLYSNAYALVAAKKIYEEQRALSSAKRVVNLTRSMYGGQHRFGTIYWNGDISGNITNVKTSISGGINSCMGGNPYWCSDIGGFQIDPTDETLTRWFQAGTFFPIFRVHGSRNTEIYNMSASVQPICIGFSRLRYRLMPYIYSLAWKVTSEGYTITRALPFDFPDDANVRNIADQFMFGPALLVNPVVTEGAVSRDVYLPAGTWYDFWTGTPDEAAAGRSVSAQAPIERIPLYVRAGSILPMGPNIQYATQSADPIELRIYPGADASFNLYEDEGDGYGYENGSYSIIPISYAQSTGKVTIGQRTGSFAGMLPARTFNVVFVEPGKGVDTTVSTAPDCVIPYSGSPVTGCPLGIDFREKVVQERRTLPAFTARTAADRFLLPSCYADGPNRVAVYSLSGRLLRSAVIRGQAVLLRRDLKLSDGIYIVKVRAAL
jgi:alpha-D-xyloside xylohydrolase